MLNKLTDTKLKSIKQDGRYNDGGGLYFRVRGPARKFEFRKMVEGRQLALALGAYPEVSLSDARKAAGEVRARLEQPDAFDLIASGRSLAQLMAPADDSESRVPTFLEYAREYIPRKTEGLRNAKHKAQWTSTIETYCKPIHDTPICDVDLRGVLKCLRPIWLEKHETARRTQQRMHRILAGATVEGHRDGQNPAQWQGFLDEVLPSTRAKRKHRPALPYGLMADFYAEMSKREGVSSYATRLIILTALRVGEALGATWSEIDLEARTWTIPAERMKMGREHIVPLSGDAVAILEELRQFSSSEYIFASPNSPVRLTSAAVLKVVKKVAAKVHDAPVVTHGFRSTFRDAVGNLTAFPRDLAEEALAHALEDTEASYRRGLAVEKRREVMEWWAGYCRGEHSNVIRLQA